ncbi:MAG TPA: hypothetical protein VEV84_03300 [Pyrinomonadaceae bacterium]|jgi:hypothetical protein|nr:hypothetical protein [Pyrinomonadaceae bacterium]
MPRPLVLSLDGREFDVRIMKIDREKLYGKVEIEAYDEKGNPAQLLVLAPDGKTLIDKGGTALATVDENGDSISRADLIAVDEDGQKMETVPSSFNQTNVLKRASIEDYLSQLVKSVYLVEPLEDADRKYLQDHVASGLIYNFDFSYRGGTEYDNAFVIGNKSDAFMIVGKPAQLQFVKLNQAVDLDTTEEEEVSAEEISFENLT